MFVCVREGEREREKERRKRRERMERTCAFVAHKFL